MRVENEGLSSIYQQIERANLPEFSNLFLNKEEIRKLSNPRIITQELPPLQGNQIDVRA